MTTPKLTRAFIPMALYAIGTIGLLIGGLTWAVFVHASIDPEVVAKAPALASFLGLGAIPIGSLTAVSAGLSVSLSVWKAGEEKEA